MTNHSSTGTRTWYVMAVLFGGAFVMGSAEELVYGMLDLVAEGLAISIPAAGNLVTANALGLMIGGPVLTWLTVRMHRRTVIVMSMTAFVILNLVPILVDAYPIVVAARALLGAAQGAFIAAAITTATSLVPADRVGRAMALVISGFATASALGLPAFTYLGQELGWRYSFVTMALLGSVVLVASAALLPPVPNAQESPGVNQVRHAFTPRVLAVLALCGLVFASIQAALTFLVPFLGEVTGVHGTAVTLYLLLYGVAALGGSMLGGRLADANAGRTLVIGTIALTASLLAMVTLGHDPVLMAATVAFVGMCTGTAPALQHRVEALAGPGAPLAASLPASAVYAGIAIGSWGGGAALDAGGPPAAVLAGSAIAAAAVVTAVATQRLQPASPETDVPLTREPIRA